MIHLVGTQNGKYAIGELIVKIVKEGGIDILDNSNVFCGIIDALAPYLLNEHKVFHRALTPQSAKELIL